MLILIVGFTLAFVGGAAFIFVKQRSGDAVTVTVTDCRHTSRTYVCSGTWFLDGQVHSGEIEGANVDDVGYEIQAHTSGGRAYTPSLRLPVLLLTIGVLLPAAALVEALRRRGTPQR
jgi:hypothetical protein